mgnify:CR=1 FL=1
MTRDKTMRRLLEGDLAIRYQTFRDLLGERRENFR